MLRFGCKTEKTFSVLQPKRNILKRITEPPFSYVLQSPSEQFVNYWITLYVVLNQKAVPCYIFQVFSKIGLAMFMFDFVFSSCSLAKQNLDDMM